VSRRTVPEPVEGRLSLLLCHRIAQRIFIVLQRAEVFRHFLITIIKGTVHHSFWELEWKIKYLVEEDE